MSLFKYTALSLDSKRVKGKAQANTREDLVNALRKENLYLVDCKDISKTTENKYKLKLNELSSFSREIGTMMGSGLSLVRTFSIMVQREDNPKIKKIYNDIYIKLQQGITLSNAMELQGKAFPELMIHMYRAGESSGKMESTAMTMADQYDKDHKLRSKIKSAMMYPIILIVITILVVIIIYSFVLPSFMDLYDGMELPLITKINMWISGALTEYWYIFIIVAILLIGGWIYALTLPAVRYKWDKIKVKAPKVGKLMSIIYTARFARTICSLYTSGISLVNGLIISRGTIGNKYVEAQFDEAIKDLRNGVSLSGAISKIDGFDVKLISSIFVGEESGSLETMLTTLADDYDYEADAASQRLVGLMEPLMIVVLAVVIGTIMISVLLPIFGIYENAGSL